MDSGHYSAARHAAAAAAAAAGGGAVYSAQPMDHAHAHSQAHAHAQAHAYHHGHSHLQTPAQSPHGQPQYYSINPVSPTAQGPSMTSPRVLPNSDLMPGAHSPGSATSSAPHGMTGLPPNRPSSPAASVSGAPSPASKPIRRRMRMITSCLECRRRKLKCNKSQPCVNCMKFSRDCVYLSPKLDEASQLRLTEIKEKVGSLERQLERDVAKTSRAAQQQAILADDVEDDFAEERDLEPTDMTALDVTYEEDADGTDDLIDLGVQVGRMRITERIGGLSRPRIAEEISAGISGPGGPPGGPPPGGPMGGPMGGMGGMMAMMGGRGMGGAGRGGPPRGGPPPGYPGFGGPPPGMDAMSVVSGSSGDSIPDFLRPGESYIPPSSGFFFGHTPEALSLDRRLPQKEAADRLTQQYFAAVHPIARCVHRPSFEAEYVNFWDEVYSNIEPRASTQAVMFAAWFSAAVSMDDPTVRTLFGVTKANLIDRMKTETERALGKANFLRTTRVETMQAFIMYMLPLCRAEVSRAHSVLVGAAVRMAECMGLHRDGETYGLNPLDTHVRRLIWHQLCFLDIRTCEAQGPRPAIRREDYDTKLPLNCEEEDFYAAGPPPEPADVWTSSLLSAIRTECNEMMRVIWLDRRRLETRKTTLTAVLQKIENFRRRMVEKYEHLLDGEIPIQRYAKLVMNLLLYRLHVMILHPYHANANSPMTHRLNNLLVTSGIMIIEISIQLENDPQFRDWAWYLGAYQQFQIALLLATEIYYRPQNREADRIWACLDYVFGTDRTLPPEMKGLQILGEIMSKMATYQGMRKMRAPTGTSRAPLNKTAVNVRNENQGGQNAQQPHPGQGMPMGFKAEPGMGGPGMQQSSPMSGMGSPGMASPPNAQMQGPPPGIVFAGVSNGEAIWSMPPVNADSPESVSDGASMGGHRPSQPMNMMNPLESVDWDIINGLFPHDPSTGELNIAGYNDPTLGLVNGFHWAQR
ncbi:fungal-specific transcription factor domain-containing protein [Colletotrichum acutatum]|uniref:Fungal-specific transcription factor domain-containing protein n=1 Tax=Glomerella acutata TaxID=27357 RepID=A0AAD8XGV0_GLOAC|nr:fungal-specific transcription factor domain-containing protein [Colletotrichum acutatum]KAK1726747.1 fungal-specific transcription factor domain-containing protein [Colletotrichum acutatum]